MGASGDGAQPMRAVHLFSKWAAQGLCARGRALTEGLLCKGRCAEWGCVGCADGCMSPLSALAPSEVNLVGCWPTLSLLYLLKKGDSGAFL